MQNTFLRMGYRWLNSTEGVIKTRQQLNRWPLHTVKPLGTRGGIQAEVGQPLSETRWKGSSLMSHLFTQLKISEQVHAGTWEAELAGGLFPWGRHILCAGHGPKGGSREGFRRRLQITWDYVQKYSEELRAHCFHPILRRVSNLTLDRNFWSGGRKRKRINRTMSWAPNSKS